MHGKRGDEEKDEHGTSGKVWLSHPPLWAGREWWKEQEGIEKTGVTAEQWADEEEQEKMERRINRDTADDRRDQKMNRGDGRRESKYCETTYCPHTHTHTSSCDQCVFPSSKHHIQALGVLATDILTTWWESIFNIVCLCVCVALALCVWGADWDWEHFGSEDMFEKWGFSDICSKGCLRVKTSIGFDLLRLGLQARECHHEHQR